MQERKGLCTRMAIPIMLLVMAAFAGLAVLVGRTLAEQPEKSLAWKLAGYAALGYGALTVPGLSFSLPLGYVVAWILAWRTPANKYARVAASTTTFLFWFFARLLVVTSG